MLDTLETETETETEAEAEAAIGQPVMDAARERVPPNSPTRHARASAPNLMLQRR
ncbi:hypothetical protein I0C86_09385 [Plantactinospora sp. S1510]|uniref:Uncharacterized protein n=1 Tax=Plantactinospora alkalitolerans TaxID=2789879 RepID=A0ABS0GT61_9ACTN|nr:hypothetical protein [Plantactinospora alkalitolerans]MBF9129188.1 hypothetical protein [Plantactinospora alkalitolerans]